MKLFDDSMKKCYLLANVLFFWVLTVSLAPNILMLCQNGLTFAAKVANLLLPSCLYLWITSYIKRSWINMLIMFPFLFLSAFQIVLNYLYDNPVISVDMWLNLVTTNSSEVKELLNNLWEALIIVSLLYVPPIVAGVISFLRKWDISPGLGKTLRKTSLWCGVVGVISLCIAHSEKLSASVKDIFPINAVINLCEAISQQSQVANYRHSSSHFVFNAESDSASDLRQVHIIVIGETSRADSWSLFGYHRNTTAGLDSLSGIIGFNKTLSQSNTTHKSVPLLMSHLDATNFGDSIYRVKSLISAFKEAGFKTTYFSNQRRNHSFIDFFGEEADKCVFINDNQKDGLTKKDCDLLNMIESELKIGNERQLIVLHQYGSHFNYLDRYGDESRRYCPDFYPEAGKQYRNELINAYDNSIVETSRFLNQIINMLSASNLSATILYASDHGEDIFDDERNRFLHASPTPTYYQLHVPFIIWMSPAYLALNQDKAMAAYQNSGSLVSSSTSFFHTALDLANIRCNVYDCKLSVVSDKYHPLTPGFLNDHNEFTTLDESGFAEQDFKQLEKIGIHVVRNRK